MTLVVIGGVVLAVGVALALAFGNKPWSGNTDEPTAGRDDDRAGPPIEGADRPAGPGAETMHPDRLGGDHEPPRV